MISLTDTVKRGGRKALFLGSLAAASGLYGCATVQRTETVYGSPVHKKEAVEGQISRKFYVSEVARKNNQLNVVVNQQSIRNDKNVEYDEVNVSDVQYEVTRRANAEGVIVGGLIKYPTLSAVRLGIPIAYDIVRLCMLQPQKTIFSKMATGDKGVGVWAPKNEDQYSSVDESTKRIISQQNHIERKNERNSSTPIVINNVPAINTDVKMSYGNSSQVKRTNDSGTVIFDIAGNSGPITFETLAKDGINDRYELK